MEFPSSGAKPLHVEAFDTTQHLAHAKKQAHARGFDKITIVDADTHHDEGGSIRQMLKYIDSPVERFLTRAVSNEGRRPGVPLNISYQDTGGRIQRFAARKLEQTPANVHRDITLTRRSMEAMGATFGVLYPTTAMRLSTSPRRTGSSRSRSPTTAGSPTISCRRSRSSRACCICRCTMPPTALAMVEELGGKPGIAGCVVASRRATRRCSRKAW